jgi:hypothetical protein
MRTTTVPRSRLLAGLTAIALAISVWVVAPGVGAEQQIVRVGPDREHTTIQQGVTAAPPGALVLVDEGVYDGDVVIPADKTGLTIRGMDRNGVILDGGFAQRTAITALADGVTMENMTARNFEANGFYWRGVRDYEGRFLTTYRVGLYGIYAFDSVGGVFEDSLASGSGDAAFYIGQCRPCDATIENVIGEWSALGYSGTNAGGNLTIKDSIWRDNGSGIVPNSLDSQRDPPQRGGTNIVGNLIERSGNVESPGFGIAGAILGHGVGLAGGSQNVVQRNTITDSTGYGVVIFPIPGGQQVYVPNDNTVRDNVFADNGAADLGLSVGTGTGNCFTGNDHTSSAPTGLEDDYPCDDDSALMKRVPLVGSAEVGAALAEDYLAAETGTMERGDYRDTPVPEEQPTMPNPDPTVGDEG